MQFFKTLLLGIPLALCAAQPARAQELTEYNVKAAFIYNFTKFVEWPGDSAISNNTSINICTVGANPFGEAMAVFRKASTDKLKLNVVPRTAGSLAGCHIAFYTSGVPVGVTDHVLTVGEGDDFVENGGMIGFKLVDNKVKIEINRQAATDADLKINPQLLEVAVKVIK